MQNIYNCQWNTFLPNLSAPSTECESRIWKARNDQVFVLSYSLPRVLMQPIVTKSFARCARVLLGWIMALLFEDATFWLDVQFAGNFHAMTIRISSRHEEVSTFHSWITFKNVKFFYVLFDIRTRLCTLGSVPNMHYFLTTDPIYT